MKIRFSIKQHLLAGTAGLTALVLTAPAQAADAANSGSIGNPDDIVVTATKVNAETPITASVHSAEPQSIITRAIIEDSVAKSDDFMSIAALTPSASTTNLGNGPGFGDAKLNLRGFKDGQYNVTIDGIPFGDSNDPSHHATAYFPDGTYDRIIIDRGPGSATDLGQASYGGNVHIVSRSPEDKFGVEVLGLYGSFNSQLERLTVNSGDIGKFKLIAVGEHKKTDGALTAVPGEWYNGFIKGELDVASNLKLTLLGTYNHSILYQPDSSKGASCYVNAGSPSQAPAEISASQCDANSQIGTYGINFGAITPGQAATSPWSPGRNDWNWQNKTTDFEIFRLQWDVTPNITIDNKVYTYFYKNFTFEADNVSTPCPAATSDATHCGNQSVFPTQVAGSSSLPNGTPIPVSGPALVGDIPGHTKLNQYRQIGDILQINVKTGIGTAKVGFWYEHSRSHRIGYDYDLTKLSAAGGLGADYFNFAIANSGAYWNYNKKDNATNVQANGQPVPLYLSYDEYTGWEQYQGFGEFEFKLFDDKLTLTPGVKVQNFTRSSNTPLATQSARLGLVSEQSYKPTLPYFTANYLIKPNFSVYAQFAKGFLIPALSASLESANGAGVPLTPAPTRTTNYQAGMVYAGDRINFDADVYYIKASNSTSTDPAQPGTLIVNGNPATYKGIEAQLSIVLAKGLTGIVNGSINDAHDDVTGLWLPNAPNHTAMIGAVYRNGGLRLSYTHKFTGRQYANSAQITPATATAPAVNSSYILPGYSTGTAVASYTWDKFTISLSVNNVFNDRSTTAIGLGAYTAATNSFNSVGTYYTFQSPRTFEGSIRVKL